MNSSFRTQRLALLIFFLTAWTFDSIAQTSGGAQFSGNPLNKALNKALSFTNLMFTNVTGHLTPEEHVRLHKYSALRTFLIESDRRLGFGSELTLSEEEMAVNGLLMRLVDEEMERDIKDGFLPLPGPTYTTNMIDVPLPIFGNTTLVQIPLITVTNRMSASPVYQFLRRMPKGAALHLHSDSAGRVEFIVDKAASLTNCYAYFPEACEPPLAPNNIDSRGQLCLTNGPPRDGYVSVGKLLKKDPSYRGVFQNLLTVTPRDALASALKGNPWDKFGSCFPLIWGLVNQREVYRSYIADAFITLARDGIDFVELRCKMPAFDNPEGANDEEKVQDCLRQFVAIRQDVWTAMGNTNFNLKLILTGNRGVALTNTFNALTNAIRIRVQYNAMPEFANMIAGFDVVGSEDFDKHEADYVGLWLHLDDIDRKDAPLYLHAGESSWVRDVNLYDAILFGTRRLGHGFNLFRFPSLMEFVKAEGIALEICPISNMLLGVCVDPRLHPGYTYLQRGIPVVICSDDPAFFGYNGLSPDFWVVTMAWDLDLRALKKLARNSIEYSSMTALEKDLALKNWQTQWRHFIQEIKSGIQRDGTWKYDPLDEL